MPVSDLNNITPIMNEVARLMPRYVLDLGIGFGKYGVLCREVLDITAGRLQRSQWQTQITGVEAFAEYANDIYNYVYDRVLYENFAVFATRGDYHGYDLVLLIDSLEHIEKERGEQVLDELLRRNKHVIVSCPTGQHYLAQGAVNGNEYERHRAHWTQHDFANRGGKIIYQGVCVIASIEGKR